MKYFPVFFHLVFKFWCIFDKYNTSHLGWATFQVLNIPVWLGWPSLAAQLKVSCQFPEIQGAEEHVKQHCTDIVSKIQKLIFLENSVEK